MAKLPAKDYFVAGPISSGGTSSQNAVSALNDIRDVVSQLPGGWSPKVYTISSGVISPDNSRCVVDTESSASTDNLDKIDPVNMFTNTDTEAGRIILLSNKDSTRKVVMKHGMGGTGQILTYNSNDMELADPNIVAVLHWDPTSTSWILLGFLLSDSNLPTPLSMRVSSTGDILKGTNTANVAQITLYRAQNTTSQLACLNFTGNDSSGAEKTYAKICSEAVSTTSGAHDGNLKLYVESSASDLEVMELNKNRVNMKLTTSLKLPSGTTAQQPSTPVAGDLRYNTDINNIEFYDNSGWKTMQSGDWDLEQIFSFSSSYGNWVFTVTHNFGSIPRRHEVYMESTAVETGYNVGDLVPFEMISKGTEVLGKSIVLRENEMRIYIKDYPWILDLSSFRMIQANLSKWQLRVRLWK